MFVFLRSAVPCKPNRLMIRAPIPAPTIPAPPLPDLEDSDDEMNYEDVLDVSDVEHLMKPQSLPNSSPPMSQFEQPHSNPPTPCGGPALPHGMVKRNCLGAPVLFRQSKQVVLVLMIVFDYYNSFF